MPKSLLQAVYLLSAVNVSAASADNNTRKFSGVANSGKPFSHYGTQTIVDLADISYHDKVPALLTHDRDKRVGFGVLSVQNNQLIITGTLLDNDDAHRIADDADAGFPWQLSAHVTPNQIDELAHGQEAVVNGHTVTGPMLILRQAHIPEISFTPTGVDNQTSAVVLSTTQQGGTQQTSPQNSDTKDTTMTDRAMTLEEALAKIKELEAENQAKQDKIDELEAQAKAKEKQADVDAQLSQAGFKRNDDGKSYTGVSDATYQVLLSAEADAATAMIGDLARSLQLSDDSEGNGKGDGKTHQLPSFLLGEQHPPSHDAAGIKLSDNPLIADAQARGQQQQGFV